MKLKELLPYTLAAVLLVFLLISRCNEPERVQAPDDEKIAMLQEKIISQKKEIDSLLEVNKSLSGKIIYVREETAADIAKIDTDIKLDSSNSITQYRKSLELFGVKADYGEELTYREIGFGSKLLREGYGMKLQVKLFEQKENNYKNIIAGFEKNEVDFHSIVREKHLQIEFWKEKFEETQSVWYDLFVVVAGVGAGYTGEKLVPTIGITAGIRLWGSK